MKLKTIRKAVLSLFIVISIYLCHGASQLYAGDNRNVILVLDTSMSMIGFGGKDILEDVKGSIARYIDKLQDGDKVTFMTFDTEVRTYPAILVDDENDRDILKKYISMTEAKGKWTYTINMMKEVFKKAEELSSADKDRKLVIVIMTDALDDPPPGKRKESFDIKSVASDYAGKDWWIYLVSYSDLKKNEKVINELKKELEKVSSKSKIISAGERPEESFREVQKDELPDEGFPVSIIIAIVVVVGIIIFLVVKKGGGPVVTGRLEYWNTEILDPYIEKFDASRHMSNEIVIGKGVNCHLNLHDFAFPGSFSIIADKKSGGSMLKVPENIEFEFKNKEGGNILQDGDIFQVANYGFKYMAS